MYEHMWIYYLLTVYNLHGYVPSQSSGVAPAKFLAHKSSMRWLRVHYGDLIIRINYFRMLCLIKVCEPLQ